MVSMCRRCKRGVLLLAVAVSGCASPYHWYPCGCVDYGYCAPAPLPHADYSGCPTPIAAQRDNEEPAGGATQSE